MASQVEQYGVFDVSPQPILVFETETGALVDANEAAADLLEYDAEDCSSLSVTALGLAAGDVRDALDADEPVHWSLAAADGTTRPVTADLRPAGGERTQTLAFLRSAAPGDPGGFSADDSTTHLTELTDYTDDVLWLYTADWQEVLFVNDAYEDVFGQPADRLREDPMALLEAIHPDDRDDVLAGMERLSAGEPAQIEFRVNPEADFERWAWVEAQPVFDGEEVARIAGYTRDVTERKRRERILEETRERLAVLHESAPDAVVAADVESGELVQVNAAAEDLFGRSREDLLDGRFTTLHPPDERERYVDLFENHVEGDDASTFSQFDDGSWVYAVTGDGERVPVEINARTVELDGRPTVYAIFRDVSDRKRTQERFEALTEMARELVDVDTQAEAFEVATTTVEDNLGYPFAAVWTPTDEGLTLSTVGDSAADVVDGDRHYSHPRGGAVWQAFESGEVTAIRDVDDGFTAGDVPVESALLVPLDGHALLSIATADGDGLDEMAVHLGTILGGHLTAVLDRLGQERELETYRTELERSNESLQQFAYVASHDLQEPLRMVSSYVDLLAMEYEDELDAEAAEYIEFAVDGAERMRGMIDALLEYSRVQTRANEFETVEMDDVVDDVLTSLALMIDERDATVDCESLPAVTGDPDQLGQVVQNLVKNALEHAGDEPPTVRISAAETEAGYRFAVADDGVGVPEDRQERIFDVFQSDATTRDGTGIGLAVCERIVARHGGDIWVESTPGEGATFYFTLSTSAKVTTGGI